MERRTALLSLLCTVLACGDDSGTGPVDGGPGMPDAGPVAAEMRAIDTMRLASGTGPDSLHSLQMANRFDESCAVESFGSCRYESCQQGSTTDPRPTYGEIRFETDVVDETYAPAANGIYGNGVGLPGPGWVDGPIVLSGAGGDLPEFRESFAPPVPITLTAPLDEVTVAPGEDVEVTWTGGEPGTRAVLTLRLSTATLRCQAPSEAGALTVSSEAIDRIVPEGVATSLVGTLEGQAGVELMPRSGRTLRLTAATGADALLVTVPADF